MLTLLQGVILIFLRCLVARGLEGTAYFNSEGIRGNVKFEQSREDESVTVVVDLNGLSNGSYSWSIHTYPLDLTLEPCSMDVFGQVFDPYDTLKMGGCNQSNVTNCALGNLTALVGPLNTSLTTSVLQDPFSLFSLNSVIGRSLVIELPNMVFICANIEPPEGTIRGISPFRYQQIKRIYGNIWFWEIPALSLTSVYVSLSKPEDSSGHTWHVHEEAVGSGSCDEAGGHYDPLGANGTSGYNCSSLNQSTCEVGDLAGKSSTLSFHDGLSRLFYQDSQLPLIERHGATILNRSVVVHNANGDPKRVDCADIVRFPVRSAKAEFDTGNITGAILLQQRSPYEHTTVNFNLTGLSNIKNIKIIESCRQDDLFNPNGRVPPVGDLGERLFLPGMPDPSMPYEDPLLPLFGQHSVLGWSVVLEEADGSRLACSSITRTGPVVILQAVFKLNGLEGTLVFTQLQDDPLSETTIVLEAPPKNASSTQLPSDSEGPVTSTVVVPPGTSERSMVTMATSTVVVDTSVRIVSAVSSMLTSSQEATPSSSTSTVAMLSSSSPDGPSPSTGGPSPSLGGPSPSIDGPSPSIGGPSPSTGGPSPSIGGPSPSIGGPSPSTGGPSSSLDRSSSSEVQEGSTGSISSSGTSSQSSEVTSSTATTSLFSSLNAVASSTSVSTDSSVLPKNPSSQLSSVSISVTTSATSPSISEAVQSSSEDETSSVPDISNAATQQSAMSSNSIRSSPTTLLEITPTFSVTVSPSSSVQTAPDMSTSLPVPGRRKRLLLSKVDQRPSVSRKTKRQVDMLSWSIRPSCEDGVPESPSGCAVDTPLACDLGDLEGKHGSLVPDGSPYRVFNDPYLPLTGENGIDGSVLVLEMSGRSTCVSIQPLPATPSTPSASSTPTPPPPSPPTTGPTQDTPTLTQGAIIGIAVGAACGALILVCIVLLLCCWCWCCYKARSSGKVTLRDVEENGGNIELEYKYTPSASPAPCVDKYRVNTNYEAVKEGELSLKVGDIVTVLEQTSGDAEDDIFWKVCCREAVGLFPANHMELIPINEGNLSEDELEDAIKKRNIDLAAAVMMAATKSFSSQRRPVRPSSAKEETPTRKKAKRSKTFSNSKNKIHSPEGGSKSTTPLSIHRSEAKSKSHDSSRSRSSSSLPWVTIHNITKEKIDSTPILAHKVGEPVERESHASFISDDVNLILGGGPPTNRNSIDPSSTSVATATACLTTGGNSKAVEEQSASGVASESLCDDSNASTYEYVAAFPYDGQHKDDLSFKAGDTIKVSWAEDNGWWYGTLRDHVGWFPSNHLEGDYCSDGEDEEESNRPESSAYSYAEGDSALEPNNVTVGFTTKGAPVVSESHIKIDLVDEAGSKKSRGADGVSSKDEKMDANDGSPYPSHNVSGEGYSDFTAEILGILSKRSPNRTEHDGATTTADVSKDVKMDDRQLASPALSEDGNRHPKRKAPLPPLGSKKPTQSPTSSGMTTPLSGAISPSKTPDLPEQGGTESPSMSKRRRPPPPPPSTAAKPSPADVLAEQSKTTPSEQLGKGGEERKFVKTKLTDGDQPVRRRREVPGREKRTKVKPKRSAPPPPNLKGKRPIPPPPTTPCPPPPVRPRTKLPKSQPADPVVAPLAVSRKAAAPVPTPREPLVIQETPKSAEATLSVTPQSAAAPSPKPRKVLLQNTATTKEAIVEKPTKNPKPAILKPKPKVNPASFKRKDESAKKAKITKDLISGPVVLEQADKDQKKVKQPETSEVTKANQPNSVSTKETEKEGILSENDSKVAPTDQSIENKIEMKAPTPKPRPPARNSSLHPVSLTADGSSSSVEGASTSPTIKDLPPSPYEEVVLEARPSYPPPTLSQKVETLASTQQNVEEKKEASSRRPSVPKKPAKPVKAPRKIPSSQKQPVTSAVKPKPSRPTQPPKIGKTIESPTFPKKKPARPPLPAIATISATEPVTQSAPVNIPDTSTFFLGLKPAPQQSPKEGGVATLEGEGSDHPGFKNLRRVISPYTAQRKEELTIKIGDTISELEPANGNGYSFGMLDNGQTGLYPSDCVEKW